MPLYISLATGMVIHVGTNGESFRFGGSCAAYLKRNIILTAAHCLPDDNKAFVLLPGDKQLRSVIRAERHPTTDIAVLLVDAFENDIPNQNFMGINSELSEGQDFLAFGYPDVASTTVLPPGRLFKGHFQRFFGYRSPSGHQYFAGEMNIPAPAGLSGGPTVHPLKPQLISGIVTTNVDSYIVIDHLEEVEQNGRTFRVESKRIVSYGIAAKPGGLDSWLQEIIDTF
ncbi:hypothetical protein Aple_073770 [Acrocarpospora pleiomorpha]|uniref:Peptidase S1 domain-containing protein n=1 Tax=Acrocarpospora pleiomorpha TaxID=90975 RepID=A0A5M3Y185_9ACTN|nr:trypsin-like peptidase domain-containing protein [Acrocarpospora pleiomorpha]GES24478.1 hypothetical protein Aple_073770 [Acrocarpospora pleiomorpha]